MVGRDPITCAQLKREISNYLEDDVDPPLRDSMDEHVLACPHCRSLLDGMQNVVRLYGDERMIDVPAGFGKRLEKRLARQTTPHRIAWSSWSAWLLPIAALVLFAGGLHWTDSLRLLSPFGSHDVQPANRIPPDLTVVVSEGAKEFHVPGCEFIENKDKERTMTAREAFREGLIPCDKCLRKYLQAASDEPRPQGAVAIAEIDSRIERLPKRSVSRQVDLE